MNHLNAALSFRAYLEERDRTVFSFTGQVVLDLDAAETNVHSRLDAVAEAPADVEEIGADPCLSGSLRIRGIDRGDNEHISIGFEKPGADQVVGGNRERVLAFVPPSRDEVIQSDAGP